MTNLYLVCIIKIHFEILFFTFPIGNWYFALRKFSTLSLKFSATYLSLLGIDTSFPVTVYLKIPSYLTFPYWELIRYKFFTWVNWALVKLTFLYWELIHVDRTFWIFFLKISYLSLLGIDTWGFLCFFIWGFYTYLSLLGIDTFGVITIYYT